MENLNVFLIVSENSRGSKNLTQKAAGGGVRMTSKLERQMQEKKTSLR